MKGLVSGGAAFFVATLVAVAAFTALAGPNSAYASFDVRKDAFSISNAPGWCFAMAAFSRWYYLTRRDEAPLRRVLDKRVQQRIASELQSFYSRNLIKLQADYCNQYIQNQSVWFRRFVTALVCGEPRMVLLMNKGPRGAVLHAVLAYAWVPERDLIKIYDPNYSDGERIIDLAKKEYTSLDITYNAICFPEVFHDHAGLVHKMRQLHESFAARKTNAELRRSAVEESSSRLTRVRTEANGTNRSLGIR
ncbi:MAG: hypothetical protein V1792_05100 [Pseudomonadota bacterium]